MQKKQKAKLSPLTISHRQQTSTPGQYIETSTYKLSNSPSKADMELYDDKPHGIKLMFSKKIYIIFNIDDLVVATQTKKASVKAEVKEAWENGKKCAYEVTRVGKSYCFSLMIYQESGAVREPYISKVMGRKVKIFNTFYVAKADIDKSIKVLFPKTTKNNTIEQMEITTTPEQKAVEIPALDMLPPERTITITLLDNEEKAVRRGNDTSSTVEQRVSAPSNTTQSNTNAQIPMMQPIFIPADVVASAATILKLQSLSHQQNLALRSASINQPSMTTALQHNPLQSTTTIATLKPLPQQQLNNNSERSTSEGRGV